MIKATKNINLENVKNSNYWKLISLLVWNHYIEPEYQNEDQIQITEVWRGENSDGSVTSCNQYWADPNYSEKYLTRTLSSVKITITRPDYVTYIYIGVDASIRIYGKYTIENKSISQPQYKHSFTLDVINWLLENKFIEVN